MVMLNKLFKYDYKYVFMHCKLMKIVDILRQNWLDIECIFTCIILKYITYVYVILFGS